MEDLKYHSILDDAGYCYFQFKVKPTEKVQNRRWKRSLLGTSSETQGQLVGAGKSRKRAKKFGRRKVKNEEKSPWGQCFNGPVPNSQASSGF